MNIVHFVNLVDSCVGTLFFPGQIYALVSPKDNEWGLECWWERCLEGK
jgi:hypothetical protein